MRALIAQARLAGLVLLLPVLLAACGFHLRGSVVLPPVLKVTLLQASNPWEGMAAALRAELESAGARVTSDPDEATAVLKVIGERSLRRVLSVGSGGKASEYELFEEVTFAVYDPRGRVLVEPQTLGMTRDLVFDENRLLGKVSEADELRELMHRALARQIITRVRTRLQAHEPASS